MRSNARISFSLAILLASIAAGCTPVIGDSCNTATDCSINGDRICDLARPGGACTVFGCQSDACPDNSVCVEFRPEPTRLAFTACMRSCESDESCRFDDGYRCFAAEDLLDQEGGVPIARVVDEEREDTGTFCVATVPIPETPDEE